MNHNCTKDNVYYAAIIFSFYIYHNISAEKYMTLHIKLSTLTVDHNCLKMYMKGVYTLILYTTHFETSSYSSNSYVKYTNPPLQREEGR